MIDEELQQRLREKCYFPFNCNSYFDSSSFNLFFIWS